MVYCVIITMSKELGSSFEVQLGGMTDILLAMVAGLSVDILVDTVRWALDLDEP